MQMLAAPQIRLVQQADLPQIRELDAQVEPYRPVDQTEVQAMFVRARLAEQHYDRWVPIPPASKPSTQIELEYLALWVAVLENGGEQIVGMVGVGHLNFALLPPNTPFTQELQQRQDYVELQHLRVSPHTRRQGVGLILCQTVINWVRQNGYKRLLVNTTTPQLPARNLYQKLGFQESARTFVGQYELVWMERGFMI